MKIIILIFSALFLFIGCQCKSEKISVNISYVGNQDLRMDIVLANNRVKKDTNIYYQRSYEVKNSCIMQNIKDYIIRNHSQKLYRTNKLKITITEGKENKIYYFNAEDGIKFIDLLIKKVSVKADPKNQYSNDEYFKTSELPPFKNQLKSYLGKEWMYD